MALTITLTLSRGSQSITGNYTNVSWKLTYSKSSTTYNNNGVSYYVNIAGTRVKTSTVKFPKADVTDDTASETATPLTVGFTSSGTVTVKFTDLLPTVVLPDLVVTVTVAVADVPDMAFIQVAGIVNAVPDVTVWL